MLIEILLIIAGLVLLQQGASWFVNGSSGLARKMHVSELAIGLTIVAFGTSAPELVVNTFASSSDKHEIVFGNIIGSNIFNLFLILSLIGLINPLKVQSSTAWREIPLALISVVVLFFLLNDQLVSDRTNMSLGYIDATLLLIVFTGFLYYAFRYLKTEVEIIPSKTELSNLKITLFIIVGLAGLVFGGRLVVENAVQLATQLGVSEKVVGLLIVAPGTSLPELATSIVAAVKKNNDIAVGNIVGSNIFNVLFILPISAFIRPLKYNPTFNFDIYFLLAGSIILLLAMYTGKRKQIDRWEAFVLLALYIAYLIRMLV